jgi:hypothetical protein
MEKHKTFLMFANVKSENFINWEQKNFLLAKEATLDRQAGFGLASDGLI